MSQVLEQPADVRHRSSVSPESTSSYGGTSNFGALTTGAPTSDHPLTQHCVLAGVGITLRRYQRPWPIEKRSLPDRYRSPDSWFSMETPFNHGGISDFGGLTSIHTQRESALWLPRPR